MRQILAVMMLLILVSLGFAQEPAGSPTTTTTTATAVSTATAVTTTQAPAVPVAQEAAPATPQYVEVEAEVVSRGRTTGLYRSSRTLTNEEQSFLQSVPERDGNGNRLRDGYESGFRTSDDPRTSTLHVPYVTDACGNKRYLTYEQARALNMTSSKEVWQVIQASEATQNVSTVGTARFKVPLIPGQPGATGAPGAPGCPGAPGETVYVQPPPAPCAQETPAQTTYCPPPPPPRPVVYLQVGQWAAPPTTSVCAPGTITVQGQPAFLNGGFTYVQGQRITLSNNSGSSSSATGGTGYGGAGGNGYGGQGGQGGSAWQNQGQGQGQLTLNDIQNTLNNINQWISSNTNTLNGGDQTTNVGVSTNTGVAVSQ